MATSRPTRYSSRIASPILAPFIARLEWNQAAESGERHDHLSVELEFMSVLTAQEAGLLGAAAGSEAVAVCRDAQRKFLREHWGVGPPRYPAFAARGGGPAPGVVGGLCPGIHRMGVCPAGGPLGSAELLLRPADEAASLCDGCGLAQTLPGAPANATPMKLLFDDDLIDGVVQLGANGRWAGIPDLQVRRFHAERERCYRILDPDERSTPSPASS
jgi:hypothetical protein